MNKTAIKNFAVRARRKLIEDITQKVYEFGITENDIKEIDTFEGGFRVQGVVNGRIYKKYEIKQREKLIEKINRNGYEQVIEEVAYTWFNRFIALRFMEVNEYLPTGVRVLSSIEVGKSEPDIIKEALNINIDIDNDLVYKLIDKNDTEDLYKYLIIKQCNQLGEIMPMVFEEISDYTELLLPDNLLAEGSVVRDLVDSIEEEDYKDQVEIIGWMYQYYISERKDEVFADLKKNKKITKENIPAATQLFTPKWIVKYMVENSLGRLWLESHPDEDLKAQWKYYLEEAEQKPEVLSKLDELKNPDLNPEGIKVLDPSMGSGHILVYAFDVLFNIYLKANYAESEIPQLILERNIYGLDIDDRAGQLAAFALMMKARSKNKRIFRKKTNLNICSIQESNDISKEVIDYFVGAKNTVNRDDVEYLIKVFYDAKEYGSILNVKKVDFNSIERRINEIKNEDTKLFDLQYKEVIIEKIYPLIKQGKIMSDKYDIVCTNPPYMGNNSMGSKLSEFVKRNYQNSKGDLFAVFMEKCHSLTQKNSLQALITQQSWMFLSSYEKLRNIILKNDIINMVHLGSRAFEEISGEIVQTTAFVIRNSDTNNYKSTFVKLVDYSSQSSKEMGFKEKTNYYYVNKEAFKNLPGIPIAYWVSNNIIDAFKTGNNIQKYIDSFQGIITGNNDKFLRFWSEVDKNKIPFHANNMKDIDLNEQYWIPYNKGGDFRKWYGNQDYIVFWKNGPDDKTRGKKTFEQYYLREYVSWSYTVSTTLACRYYPNGFLWDVRGSGMMDKMNYLYYLQGLVSSKVGINLLKVINSTLTCQVENILQFPIIDDKNQKLYVDSLVKDNIKISRDEWDSFEVSWDFNKHPLIKYKINNKIEDTFKLYQEYREKQFIQLKINEEELNRIFINIYRLNDEITPEIEDKDITIRKADRERDIKSFISYAIGCMFGRYSLDEDGLIYAGGEFDINTYNKFIPITDNVLVIADDDYFEDDIVNRFIEFVKITFGNETLEDNLDYIAETLGVKTGETSRQSIRRYFLKDFYNDHVKTYQKRPIYWQFDSGKQNGFKALIYMHCYDSSTVARVRIDYLHKLQKKYEAELKRLDILLESDLSPRDAAAAKKKKDNISKQIQECLAYDQVIAHVANQKIEIDLDDGVAVNYEKFQNIEVLQVEGKKALKLNLLAKI